MQARDEPTIVHFVGGQGKPWHYMVFTFQGMQDRIPGAVRSVVAAWDAMYWLAKTNKLCAGGLGERERLEYQQMLEAV